MQNDPSYDVLSRAYEAAVEIFDELESMGNPKTESEAQKSYSLAFSVGLSICDDPHDERPEVLLHQAVTAIRNRGLEDFAANKDSEAFAEFVGLDEQSPPDDIALGSWFAKQPNRRLKHLKSAIEAMPPETPFSVVVLQALRREREAAWEWLYHDLLRTGKDRLYLERQVIVETPNGFDIVLSHEGNEYLRVKDGRVSLVFVGEGYRVIWTDIDGSERDILARPDSTRLEAERRPVLAVTGEIDWDIKVRSRNGELTEVEA